MFKISTILDVFFWYPLLHLSCGISRLILWPWVSSHPHHSPPQHQHHCPHHGRHHPHKPCGPDPLFTPLGITLTDSFTGEAPLSNLQNPNWIADGLSFVCLFISSPKSTPNNAWRERGKLISSIYQCPEVGKGCLEGKGWEVMEGRSWLVLTSLQFPVQD